MPNRNLRPQHHFDYVHTPLAPTARVMQCGTLTPPPRKALKLAGIILAALVSSVCIASVVAERVVMTSAAGRLYDVTADVPIRDVAVVLGTSPKVAGGRPNVGYEAQHDAAGQMDIAARVRCRLARGISR